MSVYDRLILGMEYAVAIRQLRIAIITAWLFTDHIVAFESEEDRDNCIVMWLETPAETVALWVDSDWAVE